MSRMKRTREEIIKELEKTGSKEIKLALKKTKLWMMFLRAYEGMRKEILPWIWDVVTIGV